MPVRFPFLQKREEAKGEGASEIESVAEARANAREIVVEAKEEAQKIRQEAFELEKDISRREAVLENKEQELQKKEDNLSQKSEEVEKLRQQHLQDLEKAASLTKEEAAQQILTETEKNLKDEIARKIKQTEEDIREKSDEKTRDILISAIQQAGTDYVADYTVSKVKLPDEEMKGRIIGKEGRNIRAFEQVTGVDVEVDETPDEVRLSSFDGVRREVARLALEKLIVDGRIQPSRIEETVTRVKENLEAKMKEDGEKLAYDAGVPGLPEGVIRLLGRYKYRTSYGQNLVSHSLEVMNLAKYIAAELHADVDLVRKAALLHDIGKVMTAEAEGPHAQLGREILEKYDFDEKLINAVAAHHEEEEFQSVEAVIIHIADAISGARPGARLENFEAYTKRMRDFEDLAKSFAGVDEAYTISAGREVRVILKSSETDDATVTKLAHDIAEKVEDKMTYPGEVKVTVIREVREEGTAR
jgi:ribonuclease Y